MAFLVVIVGAIGAAAIWYFRMRGPEAVGDVVDAAGQVRGAYNRRKFRRKVEGSALTAIDDPALGAAVYLVSLAESGAGLGPEEEAAIVDWLKTVAGYPDTVEAMAFARWASNEVVDVNEVARKLTPLWRDRLESRQRHELVAAATRIAGIRGPDESQTGALRMLRERLTR